MKTFTGVGACGAYAVGRAWLDGKGTVRVTHRTVGDHARELERLKTAKKRAVEALWEIHRHAKREVGDAGAQIFEIHAMMVEDEDFNESIVHIIKTQSVNAEFAVSVAGDHFAQMFSAMEDSYMQARAADVKEVARRIISCLSDEDGSPASEMADGSVLCASDLAPGETVSLDKTRVLAFVTALGSQNSHTAILARSLGIPAVVGVGEEFLSRVRSGDVIAVDGYKGRVYVDPDRETLLLIQQKQKEDLEGKALLQRLRGKENVTLDGHRINVFANVGCVEQIGEVLCHDAGGIGLFRSEFLYLDRADPPGEEVQLAVYRKLLESMGGKKVIVRTLDIGADKQAPCLSVPREENPALGVRGIRLYRRYPEVIRTQLRALYRASAFGALGIMFPMVIDAREVEELLRLCETVRRELDGEGYIIGEGVEIGVMIETPAAALISDVLAPMVDFFSIGTNDLTQYTLACDRQNAALEGICDAHHEAVMLLIEMTARNAKRHGAWVGICGELAADTSMTERFLRMGIDELSVSPADVLRVRDRVRSIRLQ